MHLQQATSESRALSIVVSAISMTSITFWQRLLVNCLSYILTLIVFSLLLAVACQTTPTGCQFYMKYHFPLHIEPSLKM